jgi:hypothetical protein
MHLLRNLLRDLLLFQLCLRNLRSELPYERMCNRARMHCWQLRLNLHLLWLLQCCEHLRYRLLFGHLRQRLLFRHLWHWLLFRHLGLHWN